MKNFGSLKVGDVVYCCNLKEVYARKIICIENCGYDDDKYDYVLKIWLDEGYDHAICRDVCRKETHYGNHHGFWISKKKAEEGRKEMIKIAKSNYWDKVRSSLYDFEKEYEKKFGEKIKLEVTEE